METYKIIFKGRTVEGKDTVKIGILLAKFLKLPESKASQLFNGKSYALKKKLDHEKAKQVKSKLSSIGIITEIVKEVSISEDVSFQEGIKTGTKNTDFEILVGGKKCCKHCGSNLDQETKSENDSLNSVADKLGNIDANAIKSKLKGKGSDISNEIKILTDKKGIKGLLASPLGLILCSTIVLFGFMFTGSTSGAPSCSNGEVKDTVVNIVNNTMINRYGTDNAKLFSFSVLMIRTVDTNENTGAHECAAQLELTRSNDNFTNQTPIEYTVENIEGGSDFYVSVSGLRAL
ncbi:hypothetical protein EKG38_06080 [Shewanella canadensis]|uniref:Uncharacterized protein n=1 Tax=Shewanella canadensis TaxID=271096 RepID=A0A3S0RZW2_9GAMM|nr:hypothetical protein [Shewanella canadensis]RTR40281.1 hypothetical protein EKG38_06080 [Shewanella canadensis]